MCQRHKRIELIINCLDIMGKIHSLLPIQLTIFKNLVVGPSSADSANSHQGCFSRVQNANGIAMERQIRFNYSYLDGISMRHNLLLKENIWKFSCEANGDWARQLEFSFAFFSGSKKIERTLIFILFEYSCRSSSRLEGLKDL